MEWIPEDVYYTRNTANRKRKAERLAINFNRVGNMYGLEEKKTYALTLSAGLLRLAEETKMTHLRFGLNLDNKELVLELNKEEGLELLNKRGKVKKQVGVHNVYKYITEKVPGLASLSTIVFEKRTDTLLYFKYNKG